MKQSQNKVLPSVLASIALLGTALPSITVNASPNADTRKAATQTGAAAVTEISFSKDSTDLTDNAKSELQKTIAGAVKKGSIKSVSVAAWADQEYPSQGASLADAQVDLAKKRAETVQSYLETTLNIKGVKTVNMAVRPSGIQDAFKTSDASTKNTLENSGAAPTKSDQTGLFGLKGKASEALVMIYYK